MSANVDWARRLRGLAVPVLTGTPVCEPASEEQRRRFIAERAGDEGTGHELGVLLLSWMLGVRVDGPAEAWRWSWDAILTRRARGLARGEPPFFADASAWALEHESERELAGLHAWAWALRENPESSDAFESAARWVIENVQPDHATNRPWAIHVFIERAGDVEARMYAETLLHNCLVTTGEPDFFSACILLDAARALET